MSLSPGSRLGPYEVLAPIGAGGMGEVYRARDTRLGREVAVKVLPSHLSADPERRERFEREARAISSLSHPHICALHDVGREGEADYLVMELLEGETLQDRLARGALPPEQVLRYGAQISDALDAAHRKGIVHRDLKPGNIMLTRSGVKVLDFGLARAADPAPGASALTALPTMAGNLTQEGTILGTFQYMAPEQLEGKPADARTDVFALGAVLYEMATSKKAFSGQSQASLIAAILEKEPAPVSAIQPTTPPALDRALRTCLAKDPEERWQNARDLANELRWISQAGSQAGAPTAAVSKRRTRERLWIGAALALLGSTTALLWLLRQKPAEESPVLRLSLAPPEKSNVMGTLALSPDGRRIALVAADAAGTDRLWVRPLDSVAATPIVGTEGARFPFWSPDGRFLAFFSDGKLRRVAISGGAPQTLCDTTDFRGGAWNAKGDILFTPSANDSLYRVADTGGSVTRVTTLETARQDVSHRWPVFLPDGRHFLFLVVGQASGIYLGSLDTKEVKQLVNAVSAPAFAPPDHLLYVTEGSLFAKQFDWRHGEVSGDPLPLADGIWRDPTIWGLTAYSVSTTGLLAYRRGFGEEMQFTWFDRTGKSLGSVGPRGAFSEPSFSPDGRRIAVGRLDGRSGKQDIWVLDLMRGSATRFASSASSSSGQTAVWSPDGSSIAYAGARGNGWGIFRRPAAGGGVEETLVTIASGIQVYPDDWTADGRYLVYERVDPKTKYDLWAFDLKEQKIQPILVTESNETHSQVSPDSKFLAYVSDDTGRGEVYVQRFPGPGGKWPVSSGGGDQPRWRPDGKELFFIGPGRALMAVDVKTGPTGFEAGIPKKLFSTNFGEAALTGARNYYLVADQGRRFLVTLSVEEASNVEVVVNWPTGLKR